MTYHLLYEACPWHKRAALFNENGQLLTLRTDDSSRRLIEGAIVWGRVRRVEKSLGAAFVDIGDTTDGFLPFNTLPPGAPRLSAGQALMVRITRGGFGEKGARLDARVALKPPPAGTAAPTLMQMAPSALRRALHDASAHPVTCWIPDARLRDEVRATFSEKSIRQITNGLSTEHEDNSHDWYANLDADLDQILGSAPRFTFNGGNIVVEITSAVATIDVNAGPLDKLTREDAVLSANLAAAETVARICRLLDLGGSVIVDFITPRSKAHRQLITDHLAATFQTTDDGFAEVRPMSRFGLVELNRERGGPSMPLLHKLPAYIAGRILLELWRTPPGRNPRLREQTVTAHPDVIGVLQRHLTSETCFIHLGRVVTLESNLLADPTRYRISG